MLRLPHDMTLDSFVDQYWQRRPLLMRNALTVTDAVSAEELAGLACEEGVESRIVLEHGNDGPWQVEHGPFSAEIFADLPDSHWTLLVQDVDKLIPEVAGILKHFRFLPDWRVDDIMISYAEDQGSVGPHTDDYDVFLIQASGKRRWQIHDQAIVDAELEPGLDLRILRQFEPDQEWITEPGDVLYLPPGIPHWGIGMGPCLTWSVGFRAPSAGEIAAAWLEHRIAGRKDVRYRDPGPGVTTHPGEISSETVTEARRLCTELLEPEGAEFGRWFSAFISESKEHLAPLPAETAISPQALNNALHAGIGMTRAPGARILFHREGDSVTLAASGTLYDLPCTLVGLAATLSDNHELTAAELAPWADNPRTTDLLVNLVNDGQLEFPDESS